MVEIKVGNAPGVGTLRFANLTYNVQIDENSGQGTYVTTVQARFVSGGPGTISYSFASGNEDETFSIDPSIGRHVEIKKKWKNRDSIGTIIHIHIRAVPLKNPRVGKTPPP